MMQNLMKKIREYRDTNRKNRYALRPYLIRDGKKHPVAVICPGGGYRRICSFIEGHPYAKQLNKIGYHAVVVYYRVKDQARYPAPQEDLARAVEELLEKQEKWHLDMRGYSLWGSSAGGHLAASFATDAMGYRKFGLPRPGAVILSYPVVTMGKYAHAGSRNFLLGPEPSEAMVALTSVEKQITENYPPTFLWWGDSDTCVDPENSRLLRSALDGKGICAQCREYAGVDHGIGIGLGLTCEGWFQDAVAFWESHRT